MPTAIYSCGAMIFISTIMTRLLDPLVPAIAADLSVSLTSVALLATAFSIAYAVSQPLLGPIADMVGKARVMVFGMGLLAACCFGGAIAWRFDVLLSSRVVAGVAAGSIFPVALAFVADLVPINQRQLANARILGMGMIGSMLGGIMSGFVADWFGWRAPLILAGLLAGVSTVVAYFVMRDPKGHQRPTFRLKEIPASWRTIFANPRAKYCFITVIIEGMTAFGIFPYVAQILGETGGSSRATVTGLVLSGFPIGGLLYTLLAKQLLHFLAIRPLMIAGSVLAAAGFVVAASSDIWAVMLTGFAMLGCGFFMLHGSLHIFVSELAPAARGAATSLHSSSFYIGQSIGPLYYAAALPAIGARAALLLAGGVFLVTGVVAARVLNSKPIDAA